MCKCHYSLIPSGLQTESVLDAIHENRGNVTRPSSALGCTSSPLALPRVNYSQFADNENMKPIKAVVVGDGAVGKTSILSSYTKNQVPSEYNPTVFDNFNASVILDNKTYNLHLWDTAGQEDYDRLRPLSYPDSDVLVLVYSIINPHSFENVKSRWLPELRQYCPGVPIVLVAAKIDLRESEEASLRLHDKGLALIPTSEGARLAHEINAYAFVECSAFTQSGLSDVFVAAIRAVIADSSKTHKKKLEGRGPCCTLL